MAIVFFGLGGIGTSVLIRVKKKMEMKEETKKKINDTVFFFGYDVQKDYDLRIVGTDIERCGGLEVPTPNSEIREALQNEEFRRWWIFIDSQPWWSPGPILAGTEAGRIRINGRLIFYTHYKKIREFTENAWNRVQQTQASRLTQQGREANLIFIVSSLGGGTGSGMLIDFCFLIRDIVGEGVNIYLVAIDGTVTETFAPGSGIQSIGALVEIEKWMKNPKNFKMEYVGGRLPEKSNEYTKFLNGVFLIEFKNKNDKNFLGKKTGRISDDYKELASEFLYIFAVASNALLSDIVTNHLNRLENLSLWKNNRVLKYGSIAISSLVFPFKAIAERQIARIIKERMIDKSLLNEKEVQELLPAFENYIINLAQDNILSKLSSQYFKAIQNKFENGREAIENASKKTVLDVIRTHKWKRYEEWEELFNEYSKELQSFLMGESGQLLVIQEDIRETIRKKVHTLEFEKISNWLHQLSGYCEKQIEKIEQELSNIYSNKIEKPSKESIDNAFNELETEVYRKLFSKWRDRRDRFISEFEKWKNSNLNSEKNKILKEFYSKLNEFIKNLIKDVEYLSSIFDHIFKKYLESIGAQTIRVNIFDKSRLDLGDYPLTIEVRNEFIEKRCKEIIDSKIKN